MGATTIAVTSPQLGLGTTTTAIAFAETLTDHRQASTLVIDTDCLTLQLSNYLEALVHSHTVSAMHKSIWDAISMPYEYSFDLFTPIQRRIPELVSLDSETLKDMMKDFDDAYANLISSNWTEDYDYIIADFPHDARGYFPSMFSQFDYRIEVLADHPSLIEEADTSDDTFILFNDTNMTETKLNNQIGVIPHSKKDLNEKFMAAAGWKDDTAYRSSMENAVKNFLARA